MIGLENAFMFGLKLSKATQLALASGQLETQTICPTAKKLGNDGGTSLKMEPSHATFTSLERTTFRSTQ